MILCGLFLDLAWLCKLLAFIYVRKSNKVLGSLWAKESIWDLCSLILSLLSAKNCSVLVDQQHVQRALYSRLIIAKHYEIQFIS